MTEQQSPPEQMATGEGAGERGGNYKVYWGQLVTDGLWVMQCCRSLCVAGCKAGTGVKVLQVALGKQTVSGSPNAAAH